MANEDQAKFWNKAGGTIWLEREATLEQAVDFFGTSAIEAAALSSGEAALDVGCGTGSTTIELARRAGPAGRVTGLDISSLLLARAEEKARESGVPNISFVKADAQTDDLGGPYDLVFSRFGVMFFDEPVVAFVNMRKALSAAGRLVFVCWKDVFANPWMSLPTMAAASILGPLDPPAEGAPGPFAFSDRDKVQKILDDAGWSNISIDTLETTRDSAPGQVDEWLTATLRMGPLGSKFMEADEETKTRTKESVRQAVGEYIVGDQLKLPAASWLIRADA